MEFFLYVFYLLFAMVCTAYLTKELYRNNLAKRIQDKLPKSAVEENGKVVYTMSAEVEVINGKVDLESLFILQNSILKV